MGQFLLKKLVTPLVYVQNDQRIMGIILRWYVGVPPPRGGGGGRLTGRSHPVGGQYSNRPPRFGGYEAK